MIKTNPVFKINGSNASLMEVAEYINDFLRYKQDFSYVPRVFFMVVFSAFIFAGLHDKRPDMTYLFSFLMLLPILSIFKHFRRVHRFKNVRQQLRDYFHQEIFPEEKQAELFSIMKVSDMEDEKQTRFVNNMNLNNIMSDTLLEIAAAFAAKSTKDTVNKFTNPDNSHHEEQQVVIQPSNFFTGKV